MKLKEGDSAAGLALSDEIARRVAKNLKLYAGHVTSFSPQLLSCAAVVRQYSKAGVFQALPDWTTVADDDPRIKHHPRFHKMVNYRHLTSSGDTEHTASGWANVEATASTSPSRDIPVSRFIADNQDPAIAKHVLSTTTHEPVSPLAAWFNNVPVTPSPTALLEPLTPLCPSTAASPSKEHLRAMGNRTQPKTVRQHGKRKDRQAEDDVVDETDMIRRSTPRPLSRQSAPKRKKKFMSDHEENQPTGSIYVARKHTASSSMANAVAGPLKVMSSDTVDDKGFWDADTRPDGWGRDSTIATSAEHSVRYHPRKCDKCITLDIPCIVLPDKKYGFTRLACGNCDEMKITCTIDGVGVRERLQAKSKGKDPLPPKRSKICTPKSWAAKTLAKTDTTKRKKQPTRAFPRAEQKVLVPDVSEDSNAEQPMEPSETVLPLAMVQPLTNTLVGSAGLGNQPEPEPTPRDILHSIHDLGRRSDLLATNERVDVLDTRLHLVEETLDRRLTMLEKWLSTSDLQWKVTSSSLGNLSMALRKHRDDQIIHHRRESIFGDGSSQQQDAGLVDEEGVSHMGRQPSRISTRRLDNAGRSVSAVQIPGASLPLVSSPLSSRFSSAPLGTSGE
ncbi:uncharacterized protein F5147DRAFT_771428 [Suillus discolor]|uniref:Uncharacterized protein n=1 Tax=Suillus discolor TaxID=1912936 RepID=A0A9P7FC99_9AGAM|nr:uncharacterized protein F5147DRAFT_771428 [Suillus discolor]KAG2112362.1 hypothetical protein F5147DRAFT_771428 [Suillus discolor]